jgi:NADPH-dependent ferric siderophore reductase
MAETPARKAPRVTRLSVLRTEWLTPHMVRVTAGGEGIADFRENDFADQYVKVVFAPEGVTYPEPYDPEAIRRDLPREQWPVQRTYTVRSLDREAGELAIDFVHHGDEGLAGPWAAAARPGDPLLLAGPGGAYSPDPDADWHLLVGDESALPAIAVALEQLPREAVARVLIEVENPAEEQKLDAPDGAEITWLHREGSGAARGALLVEAVTALDFPDGPVHAFVHGEAETVMKKLRPHLLKERGLSRDQLSVSGYWRAGQADEDFRKWKAEERQREAAESGS